MVNIRLQSTRRAFSSQLNNVQFSHSYKEPHERTLVLLIDESLNNYIIGKQSKDNSLYPGRSAPGSSTCSGMSLQLQSDATWCHLQELWSMARCQHGFIFISKIFECAIWTLGSQDILRWKASSSQGEKTQSWPMLTWSTLGILKQF